MRIGCLARNSHLRKMHAAYIGIFAGGVIWQTNRLENLQRLIGILEDRRSK
jgi:hypothetical protein